MMLAALGHTFSTKNYFMLKMEKKGMKLATFETKGNTPNSRTFFEKKVSKGDDLFDMQSDKNH